MHSFIRSVNIFGSPPLCRASFVVCAGECTAEDLTGPRGGCSLVGETDNRQINKNFEGEQRAVKTV